MGKIEELNKLNDEIKSCRKCRLRETCIQPVPGGGNINTDIFFAGEGPGSDEDEQNKVFVGRSGKLLNIWINKELKLKRENVFVANIGKCRPPNNRDPLDDEIRECFPYLNKQIEIIKPKIIITLGRIALQSLFDDKSLRITRERGSWREYKNIPVMPTYHPSYLLRQMSEKNKNAVKYDLKLVVEKLEELK